MSFSEYEVGTPAFFADVFGVFEGKAASGSLLVPAALKEISLDVNTYCTLMKFAKDTVNIDGEKVMLWNVPVVRNQTDQIMFTTPSGEVWYFHGKCICSENPIRPYPVNEKLCIVGSVIDSLAGLTGFEPVVSSWTEMRGRPDSPIIPIRLLLGHVVEFDALQKSLDPVAPRDLRYHRNEFFSVSADCFFISVVVDGDWVTLSSEGGGEHEKIVPFFREVDGSTKKPVLLTAKRHLAFGSMKPERGGTLSFFDEGFEESDYLEVIWCRIHRNISKVLCESLNKVLPSSLYILLFFLIHPLHY